MEDWFDLTKERTHNYDVKCPLCEHKFLVEQKWEDGVLNQEILEHIVRYVHVENCYDAYMAYRQTRDGECYRINCEIVGNKECALFKKKI